MRGRRQTTRKVVTLETKVAALELRKQGVSYVKIAEMLGLAGPSSAYAAVVTGMKDVLQEPAEELRTLEVTRLDALIEKLWPQLDHPLLGLQAADRVLKVMERRARLLGLDSPVKIAPTDPTGESTYDPSSLISRLLPELARVPAPTETEDTVEGGSAEPTV